MNIEYKINTATYEDILWHIKKCNIYFTPLLETRIKLKDFSKKIFNHSTTFEAWEGGKMVGMVSTYYNDTENKTGFINHVCIIDRFQEDGIASELLAICLDYGQKYHFQTISLEVSKNNHIAISLYTKFGFDKLISNEEFIYMKKNIMDTEMQRNYNKEIIDNKVRKYAYSFDFDVMHNYMIQSFKPFFKEKNLLELGSFKGDFTKRLIPYFDEITCIEASDKAIYEAKKKLPKYVHFINSRFEDIKLPKKYDNIILTHVLEHLDDPVSVLKQINDYWLTDNGRLFLVTPNAMAPSRQIAVKMGIISHNTAVTQAEEEHGHRITYSLDTLERDAKAAGLDVVHRSGIFFKALANFQWDRLLETDIISKEYLDGCYTLGQQYPELCSSIFLLCQKNEKDL